ncbi:MAG: ferredoxin [bacterium]|nr:ferredoxin [bacterium]
MKHRYLRNGTTLKLDEDKYTKCGICLLVCTVNVLSMSATSIAITDPDACIECGARAKTVHLRRLMFVLGQGVPLLFY